MQSKLLLPALCCALLSLCGCQQSIGKEDAREGGSGQYKIEPAKYDYASFWCDASHMAYVTKHDDDSDDIMYFEAAHPENAKRIEFVGAKGKKKRLELMDCKNNTFTIRANNVKQLPGPDEQYDLYLMKLGQPAQLLATAKDNEFFPSPSGKYMVLINPRIANADGKTYRVEPHCTQYANPDFKVMCSEERGTYFMPTTHWLIHNYEWQRWLSVRKPGGGYVEIANPHPPLNDEAGKPIKDEAVFLKDLDNKVIARLDQDPQFDTHGMSNYALNPDESMVYAPCKNRNKSHNTGGDFDKVCRYRLDGAAHAWEEVFTFPLTDQIGSWIKTVSVDTAGNVYFDLPSASGDNGGIWKFDAATGKIIHAVPGEKNKYDVAPVVSADGKIIAFLREAHLYFAYQHEAAK